MAAKTRAHFPLKPECASKTEHTIESCLRRRRKPGAKCALGGRAHDHRGRPCLHRGREWSAWLERACPYCLSTASPRPQTPGRRRSRGSLSAAQMGIFPHVRPKKETRSVKIQTRLSNLWPTFLKVRHVSLPGLRVGWLFLCVRPHWKECQLSSKGFNTLRTQTRLLRGLHLPSQLYAHHEVHLHRSHWAVRIVRLLKTQVVLKTATRNG